MLEGKAPKILTVYDGSTLAVMVSSKAAMMETLLTVKAGYMKKIFAGKQNVVPGQIMNQVVPIDSTVRTLYNPTKSFRNFILPGLLAAIVQVAMAIAGAERGYENQGKKISFQKHLETIGVWSIVGAFSIFLCLSVQWMFFGMPYRGTILGGMVLTLLFSFSITLMGYLLGSFFGERAFCTQISCILVLPTAILGGYTWPVLAMPVWIQWLVKAIPFTYYGEALRNLTLKPLAFRHLLPDMGFMIGFILFEVGALLTIKRLKRKEREV
jgi:ABC-2 type transport system permease protein